MDRPLYLAVEKIKQSYLNLVESQKNQEAKINELVKRINEIKALLTKDQKHEKTKSSPVSPAKSK